MRGKVSMPTINNVNILNSRRGVFLEQSGLEFMMIAILSQLWLARMAGIVLTNSERFSFEMCAGRSFARGLQSLFAMDHGVPKLVLGV
jgi:hypothetical protein